MITLRRVPNIADPSKTTEKSIEWSGKRRLLDYFKPEEIGLNRMMKRWYGRPFHERGRNTLGVDCYGLVIDLGLHLGLELPDPPDENSFHVYLHNVSAGNLQVLDLIGMNPQRGVSECAENSSLRHFGIYIGGGKVLHCSRSRGVIVDDLGHPALQQTILGYYRFNMVGR